jgi:hypothetical protein
MAGSSPSLLDTDTAAITYAWHMPLSVLTIKPRNEMYILNLSTHLVYAIDKQN